MSEYTVFTFFSAFIMLYYIFMIPMGAGQSFGDYSFNYTEEDLTLTPDIEREEEPDRIINLQDDNVLEEGITFYNLSEVDGEVGGVINLDDYDVDKVAGKSNDTFQGNLSFDVANYDELFIISTSRSFESHETELVFTDTEESHTDIFGVDRVDVPDNESTARFEFQGDDDYLYYLEGEVTDEYDGLTGFLNLLRAWIVSVLNYLYTWVGIAAAMPFYLNIPFVMYIAYLIFKAVSLA